MSVASSTISRVTSGFKLCPMTRYGSIWLTLKAVCPNLKMWCQITCSATRWCLGRKSGMGFPTRPTKDNSQFTGASICMTLKCRSSNRTLRDLSGLSWQILIASWSPKSIKSSCMILRLSRSCIVSQLNWSRRKQESHRKSSRCRKVMMRGC